MAKVELLAPKIFKWEGGFVNDPSDSGGATNMGVTLGTWKQIGYDKNDDEIIDILDIRLLTKADATIVLKKYYWDRWKADHIINQSIADILVDWVWCSGKWGIILPQRILQLKEDGIVGPMTMKMVNAVNQQVFFQSIMHERIEFINELVIKQPKNMKFKAGWLNRLNDFKFS